jgi:superfamily II DNA or RNA helicase
MDVNYTLIEAIPTGGFAQTQLIDRQDKLLILVHLEVKRADSESSAQELFLSECRSLALLKHRALPKIVESTAVDFRLQLLLDYQESTSLLKYVYPKALENNELPAAAPDLPNSEQVKRWVLQIAEVINFLHKQKPYPILHRNLSPLTIRITKAEEDVRLLDYGLLNSSLNATDSNGSNPSTSGISFIDRNLLNKYWREPQIDIIGFGVVLDFMLNGIGKRKQPAIIVDELHSREHLKLAEIADKAMNTGYSTMADILADLKQLWQDSTVSNIERKQCRCGHLGFASSRFCELCGQLLHDGEVINGSSISVPITVTYNEDNRDGLVQNFRRENFAPLQRFRLRENLDEVQSNPGFDELISLESLPSISKLPHQKDAALKALKQMRGRALLADEVGLGKTIEAGIVLKELIQRQLARKILIFCPPQLLEQWQIELYEKFDEIFLVFGKDIETSLAWHCPRLIASYEIASRRFHADEILRQQYDLVILDEAHFLNDLERNERILNVMKSLQKKYFLLLSATPMHNSLEEIYHIVTLLRPGHFEDIESFREQFMDPEAPTRARNVDLLRGFLKEIMIRNCRQQVLLDYPFPKRIATRCELELAPEAANFYEEFRGFYQRSLSNIGNRRFLLRMGEVVERLCSSPDAFREPINQLNRDHRARQHLGADFISQLEVFAGNYPPALIEPKIRQTKELLEQMTAKGRKVLVFSQFNATTKYIYQRMMQTELRERCILYDENDPDERRWKSLRDFRDSRAGVLFCPGEASEGYNLQFANVMINFDLPWDPMKIEQRIGRIQRIGGSDDVLIFNLVLKGTIEEEILGICEDKIRMFGEVIGQVEEILGNLRDENDIRTMICDLFLDRDTELESGTKVSAKDHLETVLEEAIELSSADQEIDPLTEILFDFSEIED